MKVLLCLTHRTGRLLCVQVRPLRPRGRGPALPVAPRHGEPRHADEGQEGEETAEDGAGPTPQERPDLLQPGRSPVHGLHLPWVMGSRGWKEAGKRMEGGRGEGSRGWKEAGKRGQEDGRRQGRGVKRMEGGREEGSGGMEGGMEEGSWNEAEKRGHGMRQRRGVME